MPNRDAANDAVLDRLARLDADDAADEKKLTAAQRAGQTAVDHVEYLLKMRAHLLARITGRDITDAIGDAPAEITWREFRPTTVKGWRDLVNYLIGRIVVDAPAKGNNWNVYFKDVEALPDPSGPSSGTPFANASAQRR